MTSFIPASRNPKKKSVESVPEINKYNVNGVVLVCLTMLVHGGEVVSLICALSALSYGYVLFFMVYLPRTMGDELLGLDGAENNKLATSIVRFARRGKLS